MGALGTLGVGLSVLFGIFLAVLAGEIYYMLCCRRSSAAMSGRRVLSRRVQVGAVLEDVEAASACTCAVDEMGGFAREAALVGSFGGYPSSLPLQYHSQFVSKFFPPSSQLPEIDDDACLPLPHSLLFPIAEETKEELQELQAAGAATSPKKKLPAGAVSLHVVDLPPSSAVTASMTEPLSLCASSTSISFSATPEATPFATPPSSPTTSDTSSDSEMSSPATAASRFSTHSWSPASASSCSPATAASRFSLFSQSPSSAGVSPATANSRFSVYSPSSVAVSPPGPRFAAVTPTSSSPGSQRSSVDATSSVLCDHGPLGALFHRHYNSPSRYSPLRPVAYVTDFRHALPFSSE